MSNITRCQRLVNEGEWLRLRFLAFARLHPKNSASIGEVVRFLTDSREVVAPELVRAMGEFIDAMGIEDDAPDQPTVKGETK